VKNSVLISSILENTATIVIALIAGIIALYQVKSNIVSSSRIRWIENLRISISEYYQASLATGLFLENWMNLDENTEVNDDERELRRNYLDAHSTYFIKSNNIRMFLNPNKSDHKEIENIMDKIDTFFEEKNVRDINQALIENELKKIVVLSRKIFKEEWRKSKKIFKI